MSDLNPTLATGTSLASTPQVSQNGTGMRIQQDSDQSLLMDSPQPVQRNSDDPNLSVIVIDEVKDDGNDVDLSWSRTNAQYKKVLTDSDTHGRTRLEAPSSPRANNVRVSPTPDGVNLKVGIEKAHVQYKIPNLGVLETVNGDSVYSSKGILVGTDKGDELSKSRHKLTKKLIDNPGFEGTSVDTTKFKSSPSRNGNITGTPRLNQPKTLFNQTAQLQLGKDDTETTVSVKLTQTKKGVAKFEVTAGTKSYEFNVGATSPTVEDKRTAKSMATRNACAVSLPGAVPFYALQALSHFGFKNMANVLDPAAQVSATQPGNSPHLNQEAISVGNRGFTFTPTVDNYSAVYPPLMRAQIEDAFDLIMKTETGKGLINALVDAGITDVEHRFSEKGPTVDWDADYKENDPNSVDVKYFMKGDPTRSHHYESVDLSDSEDLKFQTVTAPMARVIFHELVHAYHTNGTTQGRKAVDDQVSDDKTHGTTWSNTEELHTITGVRKNGTKDPINENAFLAEIGVTKPRAAHATGKSPMTDTETLGSFVKTASLSNKVDSSDTLQQSFKETMEAYPDKVVDFDDSTKTVMSFTPESDDTKLKLNQ